MGLFTNAHKYDIIKERGMAKMIRKNRQEKFYSVTYNFFYELMGFVNSPTYTTIFSVIFPIGLMGKVYV